ARLRRSDAKRAASRNAQSMRTKLVEGAKDSVANGAADKIVDELSVFNREYDSPDERQAALADYARAHRVKTRAPRPLTYWKGTLRAGTGGRLLALDAAAIGTLDALASNNTATAAKSMQGLGGGDVKQPSGHLNLAVGTYYQTKGRRDIGERSARAWLGAKRPPAQAYTWVASYRAAAKDYAGAVETLESGRKRVGASAPFLPNLVSMAKAAGQKARAEGYARECAAEDRRSVGNVLTSLVKTKSAPTGMYAECVRRLGYEPGGSTGDGAVMHAIKNPVETGKGLGAKIRNVFKRG
ncbi:MAG TPA: hypothetical protein VGO53_10135, partial [Steroidobacteraceae bacterium]|nr:hypothetical protein [Steroidobacteraceae bacterium]